jgi:endonuclease III
MKQVEIDKIVHILKKKIRQFDMPIVSEFALRDTPFVVLISCLLSLRTKD